MLVITLVLPGRNKFVLTHVPAGTLCRTIPTYAAFTQLKSVIYCRCNYLLIISTGTEQLGVANITLGPVAVKSHRIHVLIVCAHWSCNGALHVTWGMGSGLEKNLYDHSIYVYICRI